jgi:hypothetical protein
VKLEVYESLFLRSVWYDAPPAELAAGVLGGGTLKPAEGLDVYRKMYWYRLVDAHYALFPRTAQRMGKRRFTRLVCKCLAEQPSRVHVIERLAAPFARLVAAADLPRDERDLAALEANAVESLLAPDPPWPLLSEADTQRPDVAALDVGPVPSLRVCRISRSALRCFEEIPVDGVAHDEPLSSFRDATSTTEVTVAFVRPRFAVIHAQIEPSEGAIFQERRQAMGDVLVALAGPDLDPRRAFERLAFAIRNSLFMRIPSS